MTAAINSTTSISTTAPHDGSESAATFLLVVSCSLLTALTPLWADFTQARPEATLTLFCLHAWRLLFEDDNGIQSY